MAKYPKGTKLYGFNNEVRYIVVNNIGNNYSLIELPSNRVISDIIEVTINNWGLNHLIELPKNKSMDIE